MKFRTTPARAGLIALLALSLFLCPLTWSSGAITYLALAAQPFNTVRPQDATFVAPVGTVGPIPTPLPTLAAGQYFESADPGLPEIDEDAIEGDGRYGFAQLLDDPSLYLVWMTDDSGTHYLVVDAGSDVLTGGNDPEKGFFNLVREREALHNNIQTAARNRDTHRDSASNFRWGAVGALVLGGVCVIFTTGACLVFVGVAGAAFFGSMGQDTDRELEQNNLDGLQDQLADDEGDLRQGFRIGVVTESAP